MLVPVGDHVTQACPVRWWLFLSRNQGKPDNHLGSQIALLPLSRHPHFSSSDGRHIVIDQGRSIVLIWKPLDRSSIAERQIRRNWRVLNP
jgi:hypothetical protein